MDVVVDFWFGMNVVMNVVMWTWYVGVIEMKAGKEGFGLREAGSPFPLTLAAWALARRKA